MGHVTNVAGSRSGIFKGKTESRQNGKSYFLCFFAIRLSQRLRNGRLGPDKPSESCPWRSGISNTSATRRSRKIHGSREQGRRNRDKERKERKKEKTVGAERKGKSAREHHSPSSLNQRHSSAHSPEAGAPRSRCRQGWFLLRSLALGCKQPVFSLCPNLLFLQGHRSRLD